MGTSTQNGVITVGNNETMPLRPDSLLGKFMKASESWINETMSLLANIVYIKLKLI